MCGRFIISKKIEDITERFHVDVDAEQYKIIYNAAPSQNLPVITNANPNQISFFKWGLIPFWSKDPSVGNKMINARAEGILEKASFKNPMKSKRCLVVSDGFYEWKKIGKSKQPYRICLKDENLFAYAGLWDVWKDASGKSISTFTIITTEANVLMQDLHHRMPVILDKERERIWLNTEVEPTELLQILKPFPSEKMKLHKVSTLVNSPVNNVPEVMEQFQEGGLFGQ